MDIRSLIAKMDAIELSEAFNIKNVQAAVGQISDAGQRHAQVATLAQQNGLPGLYDPVDGSYVSANGSTSSTAPHEVDNLLASKGLVPKNANTSTFLGKMFGTSGDQYDQGLRGQSDKVVADQTSAEFKATKFKELQDIMKQLSALKKVDAPAPEKQIAKPAPAADATGLSLVMRVLAAQVVDVQGHKSVVHKALEEFKRQLAVELTNHAALERHVHDEARTTREINHHAAERFVERHIGMAVAANAFFVAHSFGKRLAQGDAHVFHSVMTVDVQVALGLDVEVNQTMTCDLVEHVVKETNAG
jgi:hypothetical protein